MHLQLHSSLQLTRSQSTLTQKVCFVFRISQTCQGIGPSNWFSCTMRFVKASNSPNSDGINPVKLFPFTKNDAAFIEMAKYNVRKREDNAYSIDSVFMLYHLLRFGMLPISFGMGPSILFELKSISPVYISTSLSQYTDG